MPITREVRSSERLGDAMSFDLRRLSASERVFLWRHRKKTTSGRLLGCNGSAMSQKEAAIYLGLDRRLFNRIENGFRARLSIDEAAKLLEELEPALNSLEPTLGELCFLARRRSGQLLTAIEKELGVSRPTFHALERAGAPRIVAFWTARGFIFP